MEKTNCDGALRTNDSTGLNDENAFKTAHSVKQNVAQCFGKHVHTNLKLVCYDACILRRYKVAGKYDSDKTSWTSTSKLIARVSTE